MPTRKLTNNQLSDLRRDLRTWKTASKKYSKALRGVRSVKGGGDAWYRHAKIMDSEGTIMLKISDKLKTLGFKNISHARAYLRATRVRGRR